MSFQTCVHCFVLCSNHIHSFQSCWNVHDCIHLGVHDHPIANDTCHESLDMSYQCVVNEVLKTPITKSSAIIMAASKQFLANYLLKSPASGESHHLVGSSLDVVMDKFNTLASPTYRNFVSRSKRFSRN